jgi:hypothetical protein
MTATLGVVRRASRRVERVVEPLAGALRRGAEVHREARGDDEVARDRLDAELVELARDRDGVLVVERGVAARDDEVAAHRARGLVEGAGDPEGGGEAVLGAERAQRRERRRQLDGGRGVEGPVRPLLAHYMAVERLDQHALVV